MGLRISEKLDDDASDSKAAGQLLLKKLDPEDAGLLAEALQCVEVWISGSVCSNSSDVALIPREG